MAAPVRCSAYDGRVTEQPTRDAPRSVWARDRPAPRRPALTRAAIVAAAVRVADAEGLAAVSMRRVAQEIDARVMSLYSHVAKKEDLLDLMADEAAKDTLVPEPLPADWREAITMVVHGELEAVRRHPWMADLQHRQIAIGPTMVRHVEQTLAALSGLDLPPAEAIRVATVVDTYVTGYAIRERWDAVQSPESRGLRRAEQLLESAPFFREMIERGELPHLAPVMASGVPEVADTFEQGLAWLLDGIERDVAGRHRD